MSKGKQPYIPLYIGDWVQDTDSLSLEAEAAWLKLTFKLWKASERGLLLISFSQMAKLFKITPEKTREIFQELAENNVFNWRKIDENFVEIKSRRMLKETALAKTRSESGKQGGRGNKKQIKSKLKAKVKQNPEYEYDINNEYTGSKEEGVGETTEGEKGTFELASELILPVLTLEAIERNQFTYTKNKNTDYIYSQWKIFLSERLADPPERRRQYKQVSDLTSYFTNWMRNKFPKNASDKNDRKANPKNAGAHQLLESLRGDITTE